MKQIEFYGDMIDVVELENGQPGVVMRRLVENLGLSWGNQTEKLQDPIYMCSVIRTHDTSGREQEMLVMPVKSIPAYLFSINPNKVREDLREKLARYRLECVDVLYNYWARGYAINPRPTVESSLEDYVNGSGTLHTNFLNNILDAKANTQEQREVTVEIIKTILRTAFNSENVDIEKNFVLRRTGWECMKPEEITLLQTIESQVGLYLAKHGLPETVEDAMQFASKIGLQVSRRLNRAASLAEIYSKEFETPLMSLLGLDVKGEKAGVL